jgi:hypothetical protein
MSAALEGCAVDADGHVEWWPAQSAFKPRDEPVKQVSLGTFCGCYLYATGEVDCRLARSTPKPYQVWVEPWSRGGVAAVSCGYDDACAILADGTIVCSYSAPDAGTPVIDGTFSEITCGMYYCCGLRTDGTAACWGSGYGRDMPPGFPAGP